MDDRLIGCNNTVVTYALECIEKEDEFIFNHLAKYVNDEFFTKDRQMKIPKQLLIRALACFKEEHNEEWKVLMGTKEV